MDAVGYDVRDHDLIDFSPLVIFFFIRDTSVIRLLVISFFQLLKFLVVN